MIKQWLLKKMVQSQLGSVPPEARDMVMKLVDQQPDLLMQIAQDMQAEKATGKSDQEAMVIVMQKHQEALKALL
jgi:hypothetical protein